MFPQGKIESNGHGNPNHGSHRDNTMVAIEANNQKNKENFSKSSMKLEVKV